MGDHEPFKPGQPFAAPYYKAVRSVPGRITEDAEAKDVLYAFGIDGHARAEALLHLMRAGRKPGESVEKDLTKVLEYVTLELEWIALEKGAGESGYYRGSAEVLVGDDGVEVDVRLADPVPGYAPKCDECAHQYYPGKAPDLAGVRCRMAENMSECERHSWFKPRNSAEKPTESTADPTDVVPVPGLAECCEKCDCNMTDRRAEPYNDGTWCGILKLSDCDDYKVFCKAFYAKQQPVEAEQPDRPTTIIAGYAEVCDTCFRQAEEPFSSGIRCGACFSMLECTYASWYKPKLPEASPQPEPERVEQASQRPPPEDSLRYGVLPMCYGCKWKIPEDQTGLCMLPSRSCGRADRYIMSQREQTEEE